MKNLIKIFLFSFFLVVVNTNISLTDIAKSACNNFKEEVQKNYNPEDPFLLDASVFISYGFDIRRSWNPDVETIDEKTSATWETKQVVKGDFDIYRDKEKYIYSDTLYPDFFHLNIRPGNKIIEINNRDVRKIENEEINEIINNSEENDKINIVYIDDRGNRKKETFNAVETTFMEKNMELKINNVNSVDAKSGLVEFYYTLSIYGYVQQLYDIAEKHFIYKNEDGKWISTGCLYTQEELNEMQIPSPGWAVKVKNRASFDIQTTEITYDILPLSTKENWSRDDVRIMEIREGIMKVRHDFDLRSFPFDKQKISFSLYENEDVTAVLAALDFSHQNFRDLVSKNNIVPGWIITDYGIKYFLYSEESFYQGVFTSGLEHSLEVQRSHHYYIFKVILPIFLILLICWSVFWIHPRELESKLTITIVCLLSLIAYNFVIEEDIPKLSYLTIMDYIILLSYIYATLPNFLSIISFRLYSNKKKIVYNLPTLLPLVGGKKLLISHESIDKYSRSWGLLSYVTILIFVIVVVIAGNPHTAHYFGWLI